MKPSISTLYLAALLLAFSFICSCHNNVMASRPSYDHQSETYEARFKPFSLENTPTSITAFFSPDYSLDELVKVVLEAKERIDISIPSFASWEGCTYPKPGEKCIGCPVDYLIAKETFPIFQALNNALHQGIEVNILTNDYGDALCDNRLDLLTYLQAAGAKVRYFTTVSFTHSKYMAVDNRTIVISSINYSKTSIMSNREAGIIIRNSTSSDGYNQFATFTQEVFKYDLDHGYEKPLPEISSEDMQRIRDATRIPIVYPQPYHFHYCNATSVDPYQITGHMDVKIIVSPDFAFENVIEEFSTPQKSLEISIYQITDDNFCDALMDMKEAKPDLDLKVFVSNEIYGAADAKLAVKCYNRLFAKGIVVKKSHPKCLRYSHEKYFIIDGKIVYMSTGNMSDSDYPTPPYTFPPFGDKNWRKVNRDYTVRIANSPGTIARFQTVFDTDYSQGVDYQPSSVEEPQFKIV